MTGLHHLIEALYRLRGYDLVPANGGNALRFRKGSEIVAVRVLTRDEPLSLEAAEALAHTLPSEGHAVLVTTGQLTGRPRGVLEAAGVEVWTREKLVHEIGQAYVGAAEAGTLGPARVEPPAASTPPPATSLVSAALAGLAGASPASQAPLRRAAPAKPKEQVLAASVDEAQAVGIATSRLMQVERAVLELMPRHAFRYTCVLEAKGRHAGERDGIVAVDAKDGKAIEVEQEPVFGTLAVPAVRGVATLQEDEATTAAKHAIIERHSQKVRQKSASNGAMLVADVWVRPNPATMKLEHLGLWWLPVWNLEGHNGSVRINAATGAIESEKLKRAFATDAEFL